MLLFALALAVKLVVPAGYMPTQQGQTLTVAICSGNSETMVLHLPGNSSDRDRDHHGANGHPCAFSALGGQALAAADPILLATALIFAFVFALLAVQLAPLRPNSHLRPPLRGPPALV